MGSIKVWDPFVRVSHWLVALLFLLNTFAFDEDGAAHAYVGYVLFGLVLLRIAWGFVGTRYARFRTFWPSADALRTHLYALRDGHCDGHLSHNPLGALMVVNLLLTLVALGVTGVLLGNASPGGLNAIEWLHEFLANYAMVCVVLHVGGILFEWRRTGANLISAMITGVKPRIGGARDV